MASVAKRVRKNLDMGKVQRANPVLAAQMLRHEADQAEAYAKLARLKADKLDPPATVNLTTGKREGG